MNQPQQLALQEFFNYSADITLEIDTLVVNESGENGITRTLIFDAANNELSSKKYGGVSWPRM